MQEAKRCDTDTQNCLELWDALTRVLQDREDLVYYNLNCSFPTPRGWYPDYLIDPPPSMRRGWRITRIVAAIRVADRGVLLLTESDIERNALRETENHLAQLVGATAGGPRIVALPFFSRRQRSTKNIPGSVVTTRRYEGILELVDELIEKHLPADEDCEVVDAIETALVDAPSVDCITDHLDLIEVSYELDGIGWAA